MLDPLASGLTGDEPPRPQHEPTVPLRASCQALFSFLKLLNSFNSGPLGLALCWVLEEEMTKTVPATQGPAIRRDSRGTKRTDSTRRGGWGWATEGAPQAACRGRLCRRPSWRRCPLKPAITRLPLLLLCFCTLEPSLYVAAALVWPGLWREQAGRSLSSVFWVPASPGSVWLGAPKF